MALFRVRPTGADIAVADEIASHTGPGAEHAAEALTWGADEHILCAFAAAWWLYSRSKGQKDRFDSDHILLTTLIASALPHLLKSIFDQRRPDRLTIAGHFHGVPISGKRLDAFPSGHAVHIGALGSAECAAGEAPQCDLDPGRRPCVDPPRSSGALDKRRCRGTCFGRANRAVPQAVHGLWPEASLIAPTKNEVRKGYRRSWKNISCVFSLEGSPFPASRRWATSSGLEASPAFSEQLHLWR